MRAFSGGFAVWLALAGGTPVLAQDEALRVEMVAAREQVLETQLHLTGSIEAADSAQLGFRQAGRVVRVSVSEGDRVARGQELARLDLVQQEAGLQVAEAGLAAARATRDQARQASDRATALLDRGVGTRAGRDEAIRALSEAEGAVRRAESDVDQARRAVTDTVLRAPRDGVVIARAIEPGQIVGAGQAALTTAALDQLEAVFDVPDLPGLDHALGSAVRLDTIDLRRPAMDGRVSEISPLVDPTTGTVEVRVAIAGGAGDASLLGAAVRGQAALSSQGGISLPWTALMRSQNGPAVWRVGSDNRVSLVSIAISRFGDGVILVSDGIAVGDVVVGAGSQLLYPGRLVQPAEAGE